MSKNKFNYSVLINKNMIVQVVLHYAPMNWYNCTLYLKETIVQIEVILD